ncbi:MAG: bifunctional folylpolyglutamate synthase/dihydrofolate synthase, partial [Gemmatimonadota bacterium]
MSGRDPPAGEDALARLLAARPMTVARWGLERIDAILDDLGRPERAFRAIHIAGTNGKGSTAAFVEAILRAAGHRTALYTSPHLLDVRERFQHDGAPLDEALLQRCAAAVLAPADRVGASYFEAATALAFLGFAEAGVEWAAIETGLGGRLDATNVLRPASCGIAQIAVDHTELLGPTPVEIAREKAGILKPGVPAAAIAGATDVRRVLAERAAAVGAALAWVSDDPAVEAEARVEEVRVTRDGTAFRYRSAGFPGGLALRASMLGAH